MGMTLNLKYTDEENDFGCWLHFPIEGGRILPDKPWISDDTSTNHYISELLLITKEGFIKRRAVIPNHGVSLS